MPEPTPATSGPEPLELPAGVHLLCSRGRSHQGWFCDDTIWEAAGSSTHCA